VNAPDPDAGSYRAFLRILEARDVMSVVNVNNIRDELTAAQIPGPMRGGCFKAASHAGYLSPVGAITSDDVNARGRLCRSYLLIRRPEVKAAA
jgi:hypothetical protein